MEKAGEIDDLLQTFTPNAHRQSSAYIYISVTATALVRYTIGCLPYFIFVRIYVLSDEER